jgi:hypothetical protein
MPWWGDVLFLIVVGIAVWGFISLVGFRTKTLTTKTTRTAENLYPNFADSPLKQHRYAQEHGGEWHDGDKPATGDSADRTGGAKS